MRGRRVSRRPLICFAYIPQEPTRERAGGCSAECETYPMAPGFGWRVSTSRSTFG